jgi:hypothetical protein
VATTTAAVHAVESRESHAPPRLSRRLSLTRHRRCRPVLPPVVQVLGSRASRRASVQPSAGCGVVRAVTG